jgi:putative endonuclease
MTMKLGAKGEELAVSHLKKNGYRILERNYRNAIGEIDIIASENRTIVFIEVKARTSGDFGMPFEAVNRKKQRKMRNVALLYLKKFKKEVPARFDVVSILMELGREEVSVIKNAFEV